METENIYNETEKNLKLTQISETQQTSLLTKAHNGNDALEALSQQELQANLQQTFEERNHAMNGHAVSEQALFQKNKNLCTDSSMDGSDDPRLWDRKEPGIENSLEAFPNHKKLRVPEIKHGNRNCNIPNGDFFSQSRNNLVPVLNGATTNPPPVKDKTGDLLEKTLSQYYPEQVSIGPLTNSSQVNPATSNLPSQASPSLCFKSGLTLQNISSSTIVTTAQKSFTVNGYSNFVNEQNNPCYPLAELSKPCQDVSKSNVPTQPGINGCLATSQQANSSFSSVPLQQKDNFQTAPHMQDVSQKLEYEPLLKRLKTESGLDSKYHPQEPLNVKMLAQNYYSRTSTFPDACNPNMASSSEKSEPLIETKLPNTMQYAQNVTKQQTHFEEAPQNNNLDVPHSPMSQTQHSRVCNGQQIPHQTLIKAELQKSIGQMHRDSIPSQGAQADFQRHAALRMHLLQRQERQAPNTMRPNIPAVKHESCSGFEASSQLPPMEGQMQVKPTTVKNEHLNSTCEQSRQKSILATLEQQLKQYQLSPVFERKSLTPKSPKKVKVEMGGGVTILSTSTEEFVKEQLESNFTPPKKIEPGLQSFLESPMKLLSTPIKNLIDTPMKTQFEIPSCHCVDQISEKDEGPYYTHLGSASTIAGIRKIMEERSGMVGSAIRIEKVVYTGKEGKSGQGCPIAKWVIRRANVEEKVLVLVRERGGHSCETSCIVVVILIWDGIPTTLADHLYLELGETLTKHGALTNRRCALNEERTCACQGLESDACGASFSFGCSWSMYYNGCKFARSKIPRKFKLLGDDPKEEEKIEQHLQGLATHIAPVYQKMAPGAYSNQVEHEHRAPDCRLGLKEGRPFSGVTACLDFCAHAHRDLHNMQGGSTVVCTLTREDNREIGKIPEDEQLHVLPLYKPSSTDEFGSAEAQLEKRKTGAIQVLSAFRRQVRMLPEPAKSCRQRKLESKRANKNSNTPNSKMDNTQQAKQKQTANEASAQHTTVKGPPNIRGNLDSGLLLPQPQQQQSSIAPAFQRFPNTSRTISNSSKPSTPHPTSANPNASQLKSPNSYNNVSNEPTQYPGSLAPNHLYNGYQYNRGLPMDNHHLYSSSNLNQADMNHTQQNCLPQYNDPHHYRVNYPPQYAESTIVPNGYSICNMRKNMHPFGYNPAYSPNMSTNAFSGTSSPHLHLDYNATGENSQFDSFSKPYQSQHFPSNLNTIGMQSHKNFEISMHGTNDFSQVFPGLSKDCFNTNHPLSLQPSNENVHSQVINPTAVPESQIKKEKEDVWSDSEHNFLDPEIGGVAVAPSHGSIIIECAKRELHATTPVKKPDRNHPTRISLVFYQHKNLNEAKHGLALWEAKMAEKAREKEEDGEKHGAENASSKSNGKKGKREHSEMSEFSEPASNRFLLMLTERSMSCTTSTYVSTSPYASTKVTGPYNHFL